MVEDPNAVLARCSAGIEELQATEKEAEAMNAEVRKAAAQLQEARAAADSGDGNAAAVTAAEETLAEKSTESTLAKKTLMVAIQKKAQSTGRTVGKIAEELETLSHAQDKSRFRQLLEASETADICFVIDATGSMDAYREAVFEQIRDCIGYIQKNVCQSFKFRVGCVAYRDVGYDPRFEIHDFSGSIKGFEKFMNNLRTIGVPQTRQDRCEDTLGGLDKAANMKWLYQQRILFLIADEPCHGLQYHDYGGSNPSYDEYPFAVFEGSVDGQTTLSKLRGDCGVQAIQFMRITDKTDKMVREFNSMTGNEGFVEEHKIDSTSKETIATTLTRCVRSSLEDSMSKSSVAASKACKPTTHRVLTGLKENELVGVVEKWDSSDEDEADSDEDGTGFAIASPLSNPKLQMQLEQLKKFYDKGLFTEKVYNEKVQFDDGQ